MAKKNAKILFFFFLSLLTVTCSEPYPMQDSERNELQREHIFHSPRIELFNNNKHFAKTTQHDVINPVTIPLKVQTTSPTPTIINTPSTNPVTVLPTTPGTVPVSTPITVPSINPVTPPETVPITNPITTPITAPTTNPGTIFPVPPPPATTISPKVLGQSWCVAKRGARETSLQNALDYACGTGGADCSEIQETGSCYNPNTIRDHASYAFNSYFQKNPVPSSCDFGGTAMLVNINPSSGSCIYQSSSSSSSTSVLNTGNLTSSTTMYGSGPPAVYSYSVSTPVVDLKHSLTFISLTSCIVSIHLTGM